MAVSRLTQTTLQNGFEKYNQLWDGRSAVGSMEAISSITLSSAQLSIQFNNIPSTYSHLQLRYSGTSLYPLISSNLGAGTKSHSLYGPGTTPASYAWDPLTNGMYVAIDGSSGNVSAGIVDILDYANTNKNKTFRALHGRETNTVDSSIHFASGFWNSTSAITSITITNNVSGGVSMAANSSFSLYGIK